MKVHLVCPDHTSDWIIARLVRHLMKGNGWTAGRQPDAKAEANIFFPYCQWRFAKFHGTPIAAWMTHKEDESVEHGAKLRRWLFTAPILDLRVTPSKMYAKMLQQYGPTAHIPHPVELDKFVIVKPKAHPKPIIGVAGRVYPGGRKGESLVKRLYEEHGGGYVANSSDTWQIIAAGQGWPVPTKRYPWARLPEFYQGLDVFLCTSLVEGGPVTVLEALACGRPVVIPEHVGALDELPNVPGIWHYHTGDYESMIWALIHVLNYRFSAKALRAVAKEYTVARWCRRWRQAMKRLLT